MVIPKAKSIFNQIARDIEQEGKKVSPFGLKTTRLLEFLELTENDIRTYANDEFIIASIHKQSRTTTN